MFFLTDVLEDIAQGLPADVVKALATMRLEVFPPFMANGKIMVQWAILDSETGNPLSTFDPFEVFPDFHTKVSVAARCGEAQRRSSEIARLRQRLSFLESQEEAAKQRKEGE